MSNSLVYDSAWILHSNFSSSEMIIRLVGMHVIVCLVRFMPRELESWK
jgi:hypothetical protein